MDYVRDGVQFAEIKLNVLIHATHNNIIGQVSIFIKCDERI